MIVDHEHCHRLLDPADGLLGAVPNILQYPHMGPELIKTAMELYERAEKHAASAGLILADTKFEFGVLEDAHSTQPQLLLIDEALTPDSSRFWPADEWAEGKRMAGFDKQFLREWLMSGDFAKEGKPVEIPEQVVQKTLERYQEAFKRITGEEFVRQ